MTLGNYKPTSTPQQQQGIFSRIPWWGWVAGVGVVVVLFLVMRGNNQNTAQTSPGASSADTATLADLESGLQQLLAQSGNSANGGGFTGGSAGDGLSAGNNPQPSQDIIPAAQPGTTDIATQPAQPAPANAAAVAVATAQGPSTQQIAPVSTKVIQNVATPTGVKTVVTPSVQPGSPSTAPSVVQNTLGAIPTPAATSIPTHGPVRNVTPSSSVKSSDLGYIPSTSTPLPTHGPVRNVVSTAPTPTVTASKTTNTSFIGNVGGNVAKPQ